MSLKMLLPPPHDVINRECHLIEWSLLQFAIHVFHSASGDGGPPCAITSAHPAVTLERKKAQFLPPRHSEFCCKQTTQCFGIREVLWVAENQVNIFEKTFKLGTVQW